MTRGDDNATVVDVEVDWFWVAVAFAVPGGVSSPEASVRNCGAGGGATLELGRRVEF
jgi:hypothetical protein